MIGKIKEILETSVTVEFKDGSIKPIPFSLLPNDITLDDLVSLSTIVSIPNEKYVDFF